MGTNLFTFVIASASHFWKISFNASYFYGDTEKEEMEKKVEYALKKAIFLTLREARLYRQHPVSYLEQKWMSKVCLLANRTLSQDGLSNVWLVEPSISKKEISKSVVADFIIFEEREFELKNGTNS